MSGIWSAELASRLPGTPIRDGGVVSEQPRGPVPNKFNEESSPLWIEIKSQFLDLDMLIEYKILAEQPVSGVFLLPSTKSLLEWHGLLFLHNGPWKGGQFHFTLYIPDGFPQIRPMVRFKTDVYHPYIHSHNGAMNMSRTLPFWSPKENHIRDVVVAIRECFLKEECWKTGSKEEDLIVKEKIRQCVEHSKRNPNNEDPDSILSLVDNDSEDQVATKARQLLHQGELPTEEVSSPSVLDQLSAQFSWFIDKVMKI